MVLRGCPWLFDNHLFALMPYVGNVQIHSVGFFHQGFWLQIFNLPMDCMNRKMGVKLGESMGRVSEVNIKDGDVACGKFLRVYVVLDIRKTLARGRTINMQGEKMWISFQYEKLSRICLDCGCIVHGEQGCRLGKGGKGQYGPWMRAKMTGRGRV